MLTPDAPNTQGPSAVPPHATVGLPDVLADIVAHTRLVIARDRAATPESALRDHPIDPTRGFIRHLLDPARPTAVIAEIKRRSPSAGLIRPEYQGPGFSPEDIAQRYHRAGAAAISCLTDERFFGGSLSFLARVRAAVPLPILRKDFVLDPYQILQARSAGADAVLLIAECLSDAQLTELIAAARSLSLDVLLEIHDETNLDRVLSRVPLGPEHGVILGINNRDLRAMRVDLDHTRRLAAKVPRTDLLVSESGIRTPADLARLRDRGVRIVLVGEHLMRQDDPGAALAALLDQAP